MIEVKNVCKTYKKSKGFKSKKIKALDDVSFNIERGKITALLGINGVGKSTVLKAISGLVKIDKGEILIDGEKLSKNTYDKLSFVPDINTHFNDISIKESFEFMKVFYKNWNNDKAYEMLDMFKLSDDLIIDDLSKGNIARVKIILGFCQDSDYILMDEPFSGIDVFKRKEFLRAITRFMNEQQAIVITTHEIDEIEALVDDVILLEEGKVVANFNAEEVREIEGLSIIEKMQEVYKYE
ncbi:MAG: ABC transporter ATP-binding protein [Peptostreptococcaceae bacterium]